MNNFEQRYLKASVLFIILSIISAVFYLFLNNLLITRIIAIIAIFIFISELFFPKFFNLLKFLGGKILCFITFILTFIFLTPIFYLFFMPIKFILFLIKKDFLNLKFPTNKHSYWINKAKTNE